MKNEESVKRTSFMKITGANVIKFEQAVEGSVIIAGQCLDHKHVEFDEV